MKNTRRGVLWVGLHCDVKCYFCYDLNVPNTSKKWLRVDEIKRALDKFKGYYENKFVDFMGGEPTLHPHIEDIVAYASSIGLQPTLITHGMHLADQSFVARLKKSGLSDVLMSVHAVDEAVDKIHGRGKGNFSKQLQAMANLRSVGIPFRFNVVYLRNNLHMLESIARLAASEGAHVVNFLTFNPHFEWADRTDIEFQPAFSEAAPFLTSAIDILTRAEIEANVRYAPLCVMPGYERHMFNGMQLPWDPHEWDYNSWYDQGVSGQPSPEWYVDAGRAQAQRHHYVYPSECDRCALKPICDGVQQQYLRAFGDGELRATHGLPITDPTTFISGQPHVHPPATAPIRQADQPLSESPVNLSMPLESTQFSVTMGNRAGVRDSYKSPEK